MQKIRKNRLTVLQKSWLLTDRSADGRMDARTDEGHFKGPLCSKNGGPKKLGIFVILGPCQK